ncbi:hypothetical protein CapIbe_015500 [Capra ibex]
MTDEVLDVAMQAFSLEVIAKHGKPVGILCRKYPSTLKFSIYLLHLLPAGGAGQLGLHLILDLLATTWSSTDLCDKDFISKPSTISQSKIE